MRGERKRIYVKFVFLRKKETEKNDPPLGFGAPKNNNQKKDTHDFFFLVDFEPTMMKKKNSSPPLSCDDF